MRTSVFAVSILMMLSLAAFAQSSTDVALLQSGIAAYREGNLAGAVEDLQAATQSFLSPQRMQAYVNTGKFDGLADFERALVYLALAQSRLGRESDARETMVRLMTAERIEPTYANIPFESDAADFETLFARVMPEARLPRNIQLASGAPAPAPVTPTPEPAAVIAEATPTPLVTEPESPQTSSAPAPAIPQQSPVVEPAAPTAVAQTQDKLVVQPTLASEREERQRVVNELVAKERERIQREADARIAEIQRTADQRLAEAQRTAEQQLAESQRTAEQRLAETRQQAETQIAQLRQETTTQVTTARTEAERLAEQRLAEQRQQTEAQIAQARQEAATARAEAERLAQQRIAEANRVAEQRIAEEREAAARAVREQVAAVEASTRRNLLANLRQAEAFASNEKLNEANDLYIRVVNSENVPREYLAEAAVGLYRTGAFRDSVTAFRRLGTFAKGEEDLRYYNAVALYETGNYEAAKKELACALPFIQVTDEVIRYQAKIDQTSAQRASR